MAGILHGSAELTGDLDLLWSGDGSDAPGMVAAFTSLRARIATDDRVPVSDLRAAFERPKILFETRTAAGDCCRPRLAWGGLDVAAFLGRAETMRIEGILVRYLTLDDLIAMRMVAGRPKDRRRAEELRRLRHAAGSSSTG